MYEIEQRIVTNPFRKTRIGSHVRDTRWHCAGVGCTLLHRFHYFFPVARFSNAPPSRSSSLKQKGCAVLAYERSWFSSGFRCDNQRYGRCTVFDREWSSVEGVTSGYSRETSRNCRHKGLRRNASEILPALEKPVIALSKLGLLLLCTHACAHSFQGYKHN